MASFIDFRCPKCGKRGGFCGEMKDHPGCSCGWKPDPKDLEIDEKEINDFIELLKLKKSDPAEYNRRTNPRIREKILEQEMLNDGD